MAIKIIKHKSEPKNIAVHFKCNCGCEFWADNEDLLEYWYGKEEAKQHLNWNARCPECNSLVTSIEKEVPRDDIFSLTENKHSTTLYNMLKKTYKDMIGQGYKIAEFTVPLTLFFEILGISKDTKIYYEYKHLNRYILKPCIAEINENTNMLVEYAPIREGHKATRVYFKISKTK